MNFRKQFLLIFATSAMTLGMFFGLQYLFAWTNPTLNPPSGNVSPAINEGSTAQVKDGSLGVSGNLTAPIFYDSNNTGYYIDPASVSILNDIRPNIIYDGQNTSYYVDPAGTSKFNTVNLGGVSRSSWPSSEIVSCNWVGWIDITDGGGIHTGSCGSGCSLGASCRGWTSMKAYCNGGKISNIERYTWSLCCDSEGCY